MRPGAFPLAHPRTLLTEMLREAFPLGVELGSREFRALVWLLVDAVPLFRQDQMAIADWLSGDFANWRALEALVDNRLAFIEAPPGERDLADRKVMSNFLRLYGYAAWRDICDEEARRGGWQNAPYFWEG